ncbi:hypothetical protein TA3x_001875 [Tundrisphaera sp. TA3]|uniref:hypothetical protein n=1 Tax=Tundrisphaera sp. TA3 TaxID=3435775 RepID=UPI003EBF7095
MRKIGDLHDVVWRVVQDGPVSPQEMKDKTKMRRFRNPRFAPEALERKLNPSSMGMPVMAEVSIESFQQESESAEATSVNYEISLDAAASAEELPPIRNPGHPVPGDPEPLTPGGDGAAPPPGSGDPPISTPSFPGGPGEPA